MRIPRLFLAALLSCSFSRSGASPVPRKAPELTIVEASGKQTLLSSSGEKWWRWHSYLPPAPHCQAECGVLTELQAELGPKGFQPLAVAFNDNAKLLVEGFRARISISLFLSATRSIADGGELSSL